MPPRVTWAKHRDAWWSLVAGTVVTEHICGRAACESAIVRCVCVNSLSISRRGDRVGRDVAARVPPAVARRERVSRASALLGVSLRGAPPRFTRALYPSARITTCASTSCGARSRTLGATARSRAPRLRRLCSTCVRGRAWRVHVEGARGSRTFFQPPTTPLPLTGGGAAGHHPAAVRHRGLLPRRAVRDGHARCDGDGDAERASRSGGGEQCGCERGGGDARRGDVRWRPRLVGVLWAGEAGTEAGRRGHKGVE